MEKFYANSLAEFICDFNFDRIPPHVLQKAKASILDNLGLVIGGSDSKATQAVLSVVRHLNGPKQSTILRFGDIVSANFSALANGTMAHSNDFTDTILTIVTHCGPVVVPTAIAVAEREKLDGKALLMLVVLGYEIMARVGFAINSKPAMVHHKKGFHPTGTCGVFGAAAIAGKAMGLKPEQMANALGIAGSSSSGLIESFTGPVGADTSRTHPGKAGHDGILAALLAEKGLTGPHSVFEGRDGFLHAYSEGDQFLPEALVENLGGTFKIMDVAVKYHNGTHAIAPSVDALQEIMSKHKVIVEDVDEIRANVPTMHAFIGGSDRETMYAPPTYLKAQMSLPYTLAVTLIDRELFIVQYSPEKLRDKKVLELARKVRVTADPEMDRMQNAGKWPSRIQVVTKSGKSFEAFVEYPKGSPQNPLTDAEIQKKFTRLSERILSRERMEKVIQAIVELENINNVTTLVNLLVE
jgi:2-methylcitrate dehydratase PrpD